MKNVFLLAVLLLCAIVPLSAQTTTVTLNVTDTSSNNWSGPYTLQLVPGPGQNQNVAPPFYLSGVLMTNAQMTLTGTLVNGTATFPVSSTNFITPVGAVWNITVCFVATGPCYNSNGNSITGASKTISFTPPAPPPSGGSSSSGTVGGTFGGNPSSGYTFTSTPITTAAFTGDLELAAATNPNCTSTYAAGAGFTLLAGATNVCAGVEWAIAGSASSYTGAFTYGNSQTWSGTITTFAPAAGSTPAIVQSNNNRPTATTVTLSNVVAGHLLFVVVHTSALLTSITDTLGNTFVLAGLRAPEAAVKGVGNGDFQEVWFVPNCLGGAGTDTITIHNGSTAFSISALEASGVATTTPLVDYNYNADGTGNTASPTFAGATTNPQYLIQAVSNVTGQLVYNGRDSAPLFRSATNSLSTTGGLIYYKNGIYPCQTSLQESVAGQSNFYCNGIAAPSGNGGTIVSWHVVCESATPPPGTFLNSNGCIHPALPSAYSGAEPSSTSLSVYWQRPNATLGAVNNNQVFFVNGDCRLPNNQYAAVCWDSLTTEYSSHVNIVADTAIAPGSSLCVGLTPAVSNVVGIRTNQTGTDQSYFENVNVFGYNTPILAASNHIVNINSGVGCNVNAGNYNLTGVSAIYGGQMIHYIDAANIAGIIFNCAFPGAGWNLQSFTEEDATTGAFARTTAVTETTPGNCLINGDVTHASANGAVFNPPPFFASGSGGSSRVSNNLKLIRPGLINSNFTSAATTGTTKQTLASYTFTFNTSGAGPNDGPFLNNAGAVFQVDAYGKNGATAGTNVFELDLGGTAVATISSSATSASIHCSARIVVSSVANTQVVGGFCDDGATHTVTTTAPGITGNANIVLNVAATTPTSGNLTFNLLTVEYVGGN